MVTWSGHMGHTCMPLQCGNNAATFFFLHTDPCGKLCYCNRQLFCGTARLHKQTALWSGFMAHSHARVSPSRSLCILGMPSFIPFSSFENLIYLLLNLTSLSEGKMGSFHEMTSFEFCYLTSFMLLSVLLLDKTEQNRMRQCRFRPWLISHFPDYRLGMTLFTLSCRNRRPGPGGQIQRQH